MLINKPVLGQQINWAHALSKDLVACWLMNERSGPITFDLSSNKYNASFVNSPVWAAGSRGTGIDFEHDNTEYLAIGQDIGLATPPFSICTLVTPESVGDINEHMGILCGSGTEYPAYNVNRALYSARPGLGKQDIAWIGHADTDLTAGVPSLLGVTYDGSNYAFYLDGKPDGSGSSSQTFTSRNTIIGSYGGGANESFDGIIEFIIVWSRILSVQEMHQMYIDPFCIVKTGIDPFLMAPMGVTIPLFIHHYKMAGGL